jgi:hypothetical protein
MRGKVVGLVAAMSKPVVIRRRAGDTRTSLNTVTAQRGGARSMREPHGARESKAREKICEKI